MLESQNMLESINRLRKILETNNKRSLGILTKTDGQQTDPGKDTLEYLLNAHFPSVTETQETTYSEYKISTSNCTGVQ